MAVATSDAPSSQASLLFSVEDGATDWEPEANAGCEYKPCAELERIRQACDLGSDAIRELAAAVAEAKASSLLTLGTISLEHIGSHLRSGKRAYLVVLRHANAAKGAKAYLRLLRHTFLVVKGLEGAEGTEVLLDLNFRDHFKCGLPSPPPFYEQLLAALPTDWVGPVERLAPLVGLMSAALRACFRHAGLPLPPWREGRALLSKWAPEAYSDELLPVLPVPDASLRRLLAPYHGCTFRTALRQANAAGPPPAASAGQLVAPAAAASQPQLQHGALGTKPGLPPLPRPPSAGAALAAAAVAGTLLQGGRGAGPGAAPRHGHSHVVPDVPRKVIVGFRAACSSGEDSDTGSASSWSSAPSSRDRVQPPDQSRHQQQQQQQERPAPKAGGRHAGSSALAFPSRLAAVTPAAPAAAAAGGAAPPGDLVAVAQQQARLLQARAALAAATAAAAADGLTPSPGLSGGVGSSAPGEVPQQAALHEQQPAVPAARPPPAAADGRFKSLDQLLPRMRTVKLGAA